MFLMDMSDFLLDLAQRGGGGLRWKDWAGSLMARRGSYSHAHLRLVKALNYRESVWVSSGFKNGRVVAV